VLAAEVGHLDLAADYLAEAALMDLRDLEHNSRDGLHIASLAGAWLALVAGFGGMRDFGGQLSLHPQLPPGWAGMTFRLRWRESRIRVSVRRDKVDYELMAAPDGELTLLDCGEPIQLRVGAPVTRDVQIVTPVTPRPSQPAGRAPLDAAELEAATGPSDDDTAE
jgi:alpha,alpha-trehalose phosphorylase